MILQILFVFLSTFFDFAAASKILYYQRFSGEYFTPSSYDSNYCGSSESWPSSSYAGSPTFKWDDSNIITANNFANWGGWTEPGNGLAMNSSLIQLCSQSADFRSYIFGGWGNLGFGKGTLLNKNFQNLPTHNKIEVSLTLFLVDSWDPGELFKLDIDGNTVISQDMNAYDIWKELCGFIYYDKILYNTVGSIAHTASTVNILFSSTLDTIRDDESFGLKNFKVFLANDCHASCITCSASNTETACVTCPTYARLVSGKCVCRDKFYMETNPYTHCAECHISCKTCDGSLSTNCKTCYTGYTLNGNVCQSPTNLQTITYEFNGNFDITALDSWTSITNKKALSSECGQYLMVGGPYNYGYGDAISKTFSLPLPHYKIGVYVDFYKIDKWNNNAFIIKAENIQIFSQTFSIDQSSSDIGSLCAGCYNEDFKDISFFLSFSATSVTILFTTTLQSTDTMAYWGINNFQLTYLLCDPSCKTCSSSLNSNCLSCYPLATLNSSNYCNCQDGYYMQINSNPCIADPCSTCTLCDSSCKTCFGGNSTSCLSCHDGFIIYNNTCYPCETPCRTCETSNITCTSCSSGRYLITSLSTCDLTCPFGFYGENATNVCTLCDSNCASCDGPTSSDCLSCQLGSYTEAKVCKPCNSKCLTCETLSTFCLSCPVGSFLFNNDCSDHCPAGYYKRMEDYTCQKCDESCLTCIDSTSYSCETCPIKFYLQGSPTGSCLACDFVCLTCEASSTYCTSCDSGRFYYLNDCKTTCPDGFWPNSINNKCEGCHSSCSKCSGSTSFDCTACPAGSYLASTKQCLPCTGCFTCDYSATNCTSCSGATFLYDFQCKTSCPNGTWPQNANHICENCDVSCKTCSGGTSIDCTSCADGNYLTLAGKCEICSSSCRTCITTKFTCNGCGAGSFLLGTNCILTCPDGMWGDPLTNQCKTCPSSCRTCEAPGTSSNCLSCSTGFLDNGQCLLCNSSCATCAKTSNNCTSCSGGLLLYENTCYAVCPDGSFPYPGNNTCLKCNNTCMTCKAELGSDCLSCFPGFVLGSGRCFPCDKNCSTCSDIGPFDCLSCTSNYYLQEGSCVPACKAGYYQLESPSKKCIHCSITCISCISTDFEECTACGANSYFTLLDETKKTGTCTYLACPYSLFMDRETRTCVKKCDLTKYLDTSLLQCRLCNQICKTCSGPSAHNCLSCNEGLYLKATSCLKTCPIGYYADDDYNLCASCSENCYSCEQASSCKTCSPGYYLRVNDGLCYQDAQEGEFINYTQRNIINCDLGCEICLTAPQCLQCQSNFYMNETGVCIEKTHVKPTLYQSAEVKNIFYLSFNEEWPNFFNNLTNNGSSYNISLENVDNRTYSVTFRQFPFNKTHTWEIGVRYFQDQKINTKLVVNLFPINEIYYDLTQSQVSIYVSSYILEIEENKNIIKVTPSLSCLSKDNFDFNLSFSSNFEDFFAILVNVTSISIERNSEDSFNYTISQTSSNQSFIVNLKLNHEILGEPLMKISFNLPEFIIYHPKYRLTKDYVTINLFNYYMIDQNTQDKIDFYKGSAPYLYHFLIILATIHGILKDSAFSFHGIAAINIIIFLKYADIEYPPHVTAIFQSSFMDIQIFSPIENHENEQYLPQTLKNYGVNNNFIANGKDQIIKLCIILVFSLTFRFLTKYFKNKKSSSLKTIFERICSVFCYNLFLMFYFFYLMDLSLYAYINLKYYYLKTPIGFFSFFGALSFITMNFFLIIRLFRIVYGKKKQTKVQPIHKDDQENLKENENYQNPKEDIQISPFSFRNHDNSIIDKNKEKSNFLKKRTWWNKENLKRNSKEMDADGENTQKENLEIENAKKEISEKTNKQSESSRKLTILHKDFQNESRTQKLYVIFLMARYTLLPGIVVCFSSNTYYLIGCYFSLNFMYFAYILCMQPFSSWCLFIFNILIEGGMICAISGALFLQLARAKQVYDFTETMNNGWMIFSGAVFEVIVLVIFYFFEISLKLIKLFKPYCSKRKNKVSPM